MSLPKSKSSRPTSKIFARSKNSPLIYLLHPLKISFLATITLRPFVNFFSTHFLKSLYVVSFRTILYHHFLSFIINRFYRGTLNTHMITIIILLNCFVKLPIKLPFNTFEYNVSYCSYNPFNSFIAFL